MKKILVSSILLLSLCSCSPQSKENREMSLEEKVGQILMVRCDSISPDYMLSFKPGGILMFAQDFDGLTKEEVTDKIAGYKSALDIEPYIAVDEEGGTVVRVSSNPKLTPEKYKSPQYYYRNGGMDAVIDNTKEKSGLLSSLGINMNLAPVVDVSTNPNDFIYDRSLGTDCNTTGIYAQNVISAMHEYNIASCLKHFPGYGNNVDTHTDTATDNRTLDDFRANDFVPFQSGIEANTDSILVSHNIITDVDADYPASISPEIHDILRDELGYEGIIMTDDMSMQAMAGYENAYTKAVLAGNDMIIVSDYDDAYNEILSAVKSGEIPMELLDAAVDRVLNGKRNIGIIK